MFLEVFLEVFLELSRPAGEWQGRCVVQLYGAGMEWLNYHHLLYFWTVARTGSIAKATKELHLTQPTISAQLRALETALGGKLFDRVGRGLVTSELGRVVMRYADEIFTLGRELKDAVRGRPTGRQQRFVVGVADVVPKLIARRLIEVALRLGEPICVVCREDRPERLLVDLAAHALDLVIADSPVPPSLKIRAFHHQLGESGMSVFATAKLAKSRTGAFPRLLDGAPLLLPAEGTSLRREIDRWLHDQDLTPRVVGEFDDTALLKTFGEAGHGFFFAPSVLETDLTKSHGLRSVGQVAAVKERFWAITVARRIEHPAAIAITKVARKQVFGVD